MLVLLAIFAPVSAAAFEGHWRPADELCSCSQSATSEWHHDLAMAAIDPRVAPRVARINTIVGCLFGLGSTSESVGVNLNFDFSLGKVVVPFRCRAPAATTHTRQWVSGVLQEEQH